MAQTVKRLLTMQETWVQSLGREALLEKEMAAHSSTFAWKISWTEEPGRLQSMGSQRVRHDRMTSLHSLHYVLVEMWLLLGKLRLDDAGVTELEPVDSRQSSL